MTDVQITINHNGTGIVDFGDHTADVTGADANGARQSAITLIAERARELGRALPVTAYENGRSWPLLIAPDGAVSPRQAPAPVTDPAPMIDILELHDAQEDLEDTRIRPVATAPQPITSTPVSDSWAQDAPAAPEEEIHPFQDVPSETRSSLSWEPHTAAADAVDAESISIPSPLPQDSGSVDTDPRWAERAQQPATQGIRGTVNGLGLKLAPTEVELAQRREALRQELAAEEQERFAATERARDEAVQESRRAARERAAAEKDKAERAIIQTNYEEPMTVGVMNDKGGVGKTTDALCIAAAAGRIRGGDVIAWDANETRGTMGFRALKDRHSRSVVDFLEEAAGDFTTVEGSRRTTLTKYTRTQGDNKFAVLASDESRKKQDQVDGNAFRTVHEIVGRFHSLIIVDTGNNHEVSHFKAALAATDQLVIPVSPGEDGAYAAELMLDNFIGWGYGDLVKNAVVLLHDSATRHGDARAIAAKFENRVRSILPIPFDPILDAGGQIDFDALKPTTRAAYQTAAAAISHGLADTKER
ncbi:MAG: MinD/ParA family ATP-binding protein [Brachybacterium sp.]